MRGSRPGKRRGGAGPRTEDRKSTRLNSSHSQISYAVFCLKKKKKIEIDTEGDVMYENLPNRPFRRTIPLSLTSHSGFLLKVLCMRIVQTGVAVIRLVCTLV